MKALIKNIAINYLAIYLTSGFYPGFRVTSNFRIILFASILWLLLNKIVKPIIKLLLLPINLITLGLFSWVVSVITLFILQILIPGISIVSYRFPGFSFQGFIVPSGNINLFFSYIIASTILNGISSLIFWLINKS